MVVDTHVHVVSGDKVKHPPLTGAPEWPVTEIDPLIADMDRLGIDKAVLVQTLFTYGFDNSYMIDCMRRHPHRLRTVCVIDQLQPTGAETLETLVKDHDVGGVRLMPKGQPKGVLTDPATFPLWRKATEIGIPVTVAAEEEHVPGMETVVERFPDVAICFEHMWALDLMCDLEAKLAPMLKLARYPNVHLKLAPNNSVAIRKAALKPQDFFGRLADVFGIERLMWGSNYPAHTKVFGTLADRLDVMQEDFAFMSNSERDAFFGGNALKLWPFPS